MKVLTAATLHTQDFEADPSVVEENAGFFHWLQWMIQ